MTFQTFTIIIEQDDPSGYHAWVKELTGCRSCGDTPEEAKANVLNAAALFLEEKKAQQVPVTSPVMFVDHVTLSVPV